MSRSLATIVSKGFAIVATAFTGAAPKIVSGNAFNTALAARGSLSAHVDYNISTSSITYTGTWQVSLDGSTWVACHPTNGAADVALCAAGTGSLVTAGKVLDAPDCVYGYRYARFIVTTAVGSGGGLGVDDAAVSYSYVKSQLGN